jgi:hypothetical protein
VGGLNHNHNHDLKNLFKDAAMSPVLGLDHSAISMLLWYAGNMSRNRDIADLAALLNRPFFLSSIFVHGHGATFPKIVVVD